MCAFCCLPRCYSQTQKEQSIISMNNESNELFPKNIPNNKYIFNIDIKLPKNNRKKIKYVIDNILIPNPILS